MKWSIKRELLSLTIIAIVIILTAYFYPNLPDRIPSHYNFQGDPDDYSAKGTFVILYLSICIGVYLLMTFIPLIDPFWKKIQSKYNIFLILRDCAMFFFLFFYIVILISAKTEKLHFAVFGIGMGLFFILMGNYMPKLPRNFFFGIRSPWTLASDEVWKRSHHLGGWLFVIAGLLIIILSLSGFKTGTVMFSVLIPLVIFAGLIYPFYTYKKLQRENKLEKPEM